MRVGAGKDLTFVMGIKNVAKGLLGQRGMERLRQMRAQGRIVFAPLEKRIVQRQLKRQRLPLEELEKRREGLTLFFAPEAGVTPFFAAHCMLARTLADAGHHVMIAGCFDLYPRCIVLDSSGRMQSTARQRMVACSICGKNAASATAAYGLESFNLGDLLGPEDHARIDALLANPPQDMTEFVVDDIAFGKIAGSEAVVTLKTLDLAGQSSQVRDVLLQYLRGALVSYFAMKNLIAKVPVARIVYFCEYSMMLGPVLAARRANIGITNLSHAHIHGANRQRPTLHSDLLAIHTYRIMLERWPEWRDLALAPARVDEIFADSLFRFVSDSVIVYSRGRSGATDELFRKLNLLDGKPVVVAFTSSMDEIYAHRLMLEAVGGKPFSTEQPFPDQIAWLSYLIQQAEEREEFQLVIRIHPREDGTRREATSSDHLKLLRQNFDRPYRNVRIVWPADTVSSYDLMEIADVGTSSWSSTAMEMARLGTPTVIAFRDYTPMPVGDVVTWGRTPEEYLAAVKDALTTQPRLERVRAAVRWVNLRVFGNAVDLTDVVPTSDYGDLPPWRRPAAAPVIEDILIKGKPTLSINFEMLRAEQYLGSQDVERDALLRNLRKAAWLLSFGEAPYCDYRLHDGFLEDLPPSIDAAAWREDGLIVFHTRNKTVRRRSRLVERLVQLSAQT
jgi:hypothetical protein